MKILVVSTKLTLLMSVAVILQDSVHEIYRQGVNFHQLMLISGKHCRKLTAFDCIGCFHVAPLKLSLIDPPEILLS